MSADKETLKVKKDATISALFSLYKAANDASSAIIDLINHLEASGFDTSDLKNATIGGVSNETAKIGSLLSVPLRTPQPVKPSSSASSASVDSDASLEEQKSTPKKRGSSGIASEDEEANAEAAKPKRAPKKKKDPNAPKRPLTPFLAYRNAEQKRITESRKTEGLPELNREQVLELVRDRWANISTEEREAMDKHCKDEMQVYFDKMNAYKAQKQKEEEEQNNDNSDPASPDSSQNVASQEPPSSQPADSDELRPETLTQDSSSQDASEPPKKKQKKKESSKKKKKSKADETA